MKVTGSIGLAALLLAAGHPLPCLAQGAAAAPAPSPAPTPAPDPDPAKLALARQIIEVGFPPDDRAATMNRASEAMISQMREAVMQSTGHVTDPGLRQIMDRYIERVRAMSRQLNSEGAPAIFEAMARAYARTFSGQELADIRAFVTTPSGSAYLRRSLDMLSDPDVAAANRAIMTRSLESMRPLMEELGREVEAYMARQRPRR